MQRALDIFQNVYTSLGLVVNINKTEIMAQLLDPSPEQLQFHINNHPLKVVEQFAYLGCIISPSNSIDPEIQSRLNLASSAFGKLLDRVFLNNNQKISRKSAVYHAIAITTLLYGPEAWTPYRLHLKTSKSSTCDAYRGFLA